MKNLFKFKSLLLLLLPVLASATSIPLSVRMQEKYNWDWAAVAQSILDYYGQYPSQHRIAEWATPLESNTGVMLLDDVTNAYSLRSTMQHYGLSTVGYNRALSQAEVAAELAVGHIIVAQKVSGKFIIHGISGDYLNTIDPWRGYGAVVESYASFLDAASGYGWFKTLVITSAKPATLPARPIVEADVPRSYAVYAFDRLSVNDGVDVYANPTTTTYRGSIGSGWERSLTNTSDTYGIITGAYSWVGPVYSRGPVWLRSNTTVDGSIHMKDLSTLTVQSPVTITGVMDQSTPAYNGFGWGTIDFTGVTQTTTSIEPDQPRVYLAPGKYWNYTIKARSPIQLRSGDYFFNSLNCEACTFEINASNGPVRIYVADGMLWTGTLDYVSGDPSDLLVAYLGSSPLYLNGSLDGTVLTPNAALILGQTATKDYTGTYIGRVVTVHQQSQVRYQAFDF